jgi:hypothetical protein
MPMCHGIVGCEIAVTRYCLIAGGEIVESLAVYDGRLVINGPWLAHGWLSVLRSSQVETLTPTYVRHPSTFDPVLSCSCNRATVGIYTIIYNSINKTSLVGNGNHDTVFSKILRALLAR